MTEHDPHPAGADPASPVSVLDRVFAILDAVKRAPAPSPISAIASEAGIPKSTTARLVAELVEQRYLARRRSGIALGMRMFELGARATIPRRIATAAAPVVRDLAMRTGERIGVWVQQGTDMVSLTALPGRLMLPARAGMRSPALTTASGKAFLAFCDDKAVVDRVSAPLVRRDAERFYDELSSVRTETIATDPGDSYAGVSAVASPVLSPAGDVVGAISLAGPSDSLRAGNVAPLVRAASVSLARRLAAV